MSKYLFAFHGANMPEDPAAMQAIMAKWEVWMNSLGADLIDPGSIVGNNRSLSANGKLNITEDSHISGYMLIASKSIDSAMTIAKGCPILDNEGSVQVAELMTPP